jgi:Family of unknown function (DUF5519)
MGEKVSAYESLRARILELPGVGESPHRFGGLEFQFEGVEFMHSHGDSWLDIRLSKADQASVLKTGEALPHRFAPQAGWVSFRISGPKDVDRALKIIGLGYENAKRNVEDVKSRRTQAKLG